MLMSKENAEHYKWGDNCDGWHLVKSDSLSIIQERVPAGAKEIKHYHQNAEQFFFVLSGVATLEIEGVMHQLHPNTGCHVPSGAIHQLRNETNEDIEFIVTSTPPTRGDRVEV